jgi:hypothetical protein
VPPGQVCEYPSGDVGPTYWRIPAALALGAIPVVTIAVWPRRRPAKSEPIEALLV